MRTRETRTSQRQRGRRQPAHRATWMPMPLMVWRRTPATPRRASTRRCAAADLQLLCSSSMQDSLSISIQSYAALQPAVTGRCVFFGCCRKFGGTPSGCSGVCPVPLAA